MNARRTASLAALLAGLTLVAGCGSGATGGGVTPAPVASPTVGSGSTSTTVVVAATHADEADYAWDASTEVLITLSDSGSTAGEGVTVGGSTVTITAAGTYRLSGSLADGQVVVDTASGDVVRLVLDGVSVASSTTAPLSIVDAAKVVMILADGSQNSLADAATSRLPSAGADEPNAALFSMADLTIAGEGSLTVSGTVNDGIASRDGLVIAGGTITVTASDDGIRGKDYLVVTGGTLDVTAGGDALKADNEEDASLGYVTLAGGRLDLVAGTDAVDAFTNVLVTGGTVAIAAGDDGIHAEARLEVQGGTIDISRSYEGLEATQIVISGGAIAVVAEDDGLNVAGGNDASAADGPGDRGGPGGPAGEVAVEGYYVEVSGGTIVIEAEGDGFDSNGSASITGGTIVVNGPTRNGNGAIDVNGEFLISDAVLVAAGSIGMAETPDASSAQPTLHLQFDSPVTAGTVVRIQAPDGTNIATFQASKDFQSLVVSVPGIVAGTAYEVLTGGTASGENLGGLSVDPDYAGGTVIGTVTAGTR